MKNCIDCQVRTECHESDKEMSCEEFVSYMEKLELNYFQTQLEEIDTNVQSKLH